MVAKASLAHSWSGPLLKDEAVACGSRFRLAGHEVNPTCVFGEFGGCPAGIDEMTESFALLDGAENLTNISQIRDDKTVTIRISFRQPEKCKLVQQARRVKRANVRDCAAASIKPHVTSLSLTLENSRFFLSLTPF
jgi:hypothetical protein